MNEETTNGSSNGASHVSLSDAIEGLSGRYPGKGIAIDLYFKGDIGIRYTSVESALSALTNQEKEYVVDDIVNLGVIRSRAKTKYGICLIIASYEPVETDAEAVTEGTDDSDRSEEEWLYGDTGTSVTG